MHYWPQNQRHLAQLRQTAGQSSLFRAVQDAWKPYQAAPDQYLSSTQINNMNSHAYAHTALPAILWLPSGTISHWPYPFFIHRRAPKWRGIASESGISSSKKELLGQLVRIFWAACPFCYTTNSVKSLKEIRAWLQPGKIRIFTASFLDLSPPEKSSKTLRKF